MNKTWIYLMDAIRVFALLLFAVGATVLGYLTLVTRYPTNNLAEVASSDKIGPVYTRPLPSPVRLVSAKAEAPAPTPVAAALNDMPPAAERLTNRAPAAETASLETGTLSDAANDRTMSSSAGRDARNRGSWKRTAGAAGCESFRSFDPMTQTYRTYDGRIRECRIH